jgi:hypothetical protein
MPLQLNIARNHIFITGTTYALSMPTIIMVTDTAMATDTVMDTLMDTVMDMVMDTDMDMPTGTVTDMVKLIIMGENAEKATMRKTKEKTADTVIIIFIMVY